MAPMSTVEWLRQRAAEYDNDALGWAKRGGRAESAAKRAVAAELRDEADRMEAREAAGLGAAVAGFVNNGGEL